MARLTDGRVRAVVGVAVVTASLGWAVLGTGGWAVLGTGGGAGAATSLTSTVQAHCIGLTGIPNAHACTSETLDAKRSEPVSVDDITVTPVGRGTVSVATYEADPTAPLASSTGTYFGISISESNAFKTVTVKDCSLGGGTTLFWWNGSTWLPVTLQPGSISSATLTCVTDTLGAGSDPSLATIARLSRVSHFDAVVFGVK